MFHLPLIITDIAPLFTQIIFYAIKSACMHYSMLHIIAVYFSVTVRFITLRSGLKYLRHEESRRAADPLVFVKENVATFLDAVDTLRSILKCNKTCIKWCLNLM